MISSAMAWHSDVIPQVREERASCEKSCRGCIERAHSPAEIQTILEKQHRDCRGCAQQPVMLELAKQYEAKQPRWWVVNDHLVAPIWAVEMMKRSKGS